MKKVILLIMTFFCGMLFLTSCVYASQVQISAPPVPSGYTVNGTINSPTGANAVAWESTSEDHGSGLVYVCTNGIWGAWGGNG